MIGVDVESYSLSVRILDDIIVSSRLHDFEVTEFVSVKMFMQFR